MNKKRATDVLEYIVDHSRSLEAKGLALELEKKILDGKEVDFDEGSE